jgi:proline iminopeptidase
VHAEVNGHRRLWFDVDGAALVPAGGEMQERPTIVLLHGGPGGYDHSYFKPDFSALTEVAQVVYLDVTGHGRSHLADASSWTFELAGDDVRAFCEAVGVESPIVYGHSLGAMIAAAYAVRHPDHPRALVLQSGMGRYDLQRIVEGFRQFGGDEVAAIAERSYGGTPPPVTPEEWERCRVVFGPHVLNDDERRRMVSVDLGEPALEHLRSFDVLAGLSSVACPTLVCVGELDPVTPVAAAEELAAALGSARLEVIGGAGHWTWKDAPDIYWPLLTEFVSGA